MLCIYHKQTLGIVAVVMVLISLFVSLCLFLLVVAEYVAGTCPIRLVTMVIVVVMIGPSDLVCPQFFLDTLMSHRHVGTHPGPTRPLLYYW